MSPQSLTLVDVPRPFLDTIASTTQALSVFSLTVQRPFRPQHLVLLVDASRHGVGLHSSDGFIGLRDDPPQPAALSATTSFRLRRPIRSLRAVT